MKVSKKLFEKIKNIKKESIKEIERLLDENDEVIVNKSSISGVIVVKQIISYVYAHVEKIFFWYDEDGLRNLCIEVTYPNKENKDVKTITIDEIETESLPYLVALLEDITN